jgi:hypothetical protein
MRKQLFAFARKDGAWPRFGVWTLLVLVAVVAFFAWAGSWLAYPNRLILRNASGSDLTEVRLWISDTKGNVVHQFSATRLGAGSSETIWHGLNDSSVRLVFQINGAERQFDNPYIDLWTGEGWALEIQPDGSMKEEYDHAPRPVE